MLLSRNNFRKAVFDRDQHKCVVCGIPAQDAHHIIERRLFTDGGYYLDNGSSLCGKHHIQAEETTIDAQEIRDLCGIETIILPKHLYHDNKYDKWGNIILPNGNRLKGELFYDESVQKILKQGKVLNLFTDYVKYPRTFHLPWSNLLKDDRMMESDEFFVDKEVVVTLKMDGENTTMYNDHIHSRSIDSGSHPTRNKVKDIWAQISWMLDPGMRICGENLYAVHTVEYENLPSYFMAFSMWIGQECLSWEESTEYFKILGLERVPVIYSGIYDKEKIWEEWSKYENTHEGYVVRVADEFNYSEFKNKVGKFVKPEFRQQVNQSHGHWISKKIESNKLRNKNE